MASGHDNMWRKPLFPLAARPADLEERVRFGMTRYGCRRVVLFSGAGWFFDGYVINFWPLAIPFVMTDLQLTVENIGTITTIYVTAYMLGTLLGGTLRTTPGAAAFCRFRCCSTCSSTPSPPRAGFWSLSFFRSWATGTGTGMELPVGSTFITEAVDNKWRSARPISVMNAGYPVGYVLAIAAFLLYDWRGLGLAARGYLSPRSSPASRPHRQAEGVRVAALLRRLGAVKRGEGTATASQHNRLP